MLIEKIKAHNEVNGFAFSVVEFTFIALAVLPFAVYYLSHGRIVAAAIAAGIGANALTVIALGVFALFKKKPDIGFLSWLSSGGRAMIAAKYPELFRDTIILTVCMLIPFLVALWSAGEQWRAAKCVQSS